MVKIYPFYENPADIDNNAPENEKGGKKAEAHLYRLLKEQLPDDWYVFYDRSFTGEKQENQIDFLVIVPGRGIVNLECKGSGYSVSDGGRKFTHKVIIPDGRDLIHKADLAIRNFHKNFEDKLHIQLGAYQKAIIFPLCDFTKKGTQETPDIVHEYFNFCNEPVYTAKDVHGNSKPLRTIINKLLDKFSVTCKQEDAKTLFEYLSMTADASNSYLPELNLQDAIEKIDGDTFSRGETFVDCMIFNNDSRAYLHINGTAGTGKTWIAKIAARTFAEKHKEARVLYVCYNKALAADVSLQLEDLQNVDVGHFHLLARLCFNKNLIVKTDGKFDEDATDLEFLQYVDEGNTPNYTYDLILVDEAQDFNQTKFDFIISLAKSKDRKIVFFSDINQIIHEKGHKYPVFNGEIISPHKTLPFNLRNTFNIHTHSQTLLENDDTKSASKVEGPKVDIKNNADWDKVKADLREAFSQHPHSRIAILSDRKDFEQHLNGVVKCIAGNSLEIIRKNLQKWRSETNTDTVWASTIQAFKGLEADVVFLLLYNNCENDTALQYVGITRAKYQLKIYSGLK